ncbi:MAG: hypothetical protein SVX38_13085 [Chloroflexota bacterium]|nr:hypothetical protein [Chloroflexota bacterium]
MSVKQYQAVDFLPSLPTIGDRSHAVGWSSHPGAWSGGGLMLDIPGDLY